MRKFGKKQDIHVSIETEQKPWKTALIPISRPATITTSLRVITQITFAAEETSVKNGKVAFKKEYFLCNSTGKLFNTFRNT